MRPFLRLAALAFVLILVPVLTGCLGFGQSQVAEDSGPAAPPPPPPGSYLDFDDVRVPDDLQLDRNYSFVYQSDALKTGVLSFLGSNSTAEVLAFFQDNMPRDGWSLMSSFKFHRNILIYTKPKKICLLVVNEPQGARLVRVEVWVAPLKPEAMEHLQPASPEAGQPQTGILPLVKPIEPREETLPGS